MLGASSALSEQQGSESGRPIVIIDNDPSLLDSASLWLAEQWPVATFNSAENFLKRFGEDAAQPACLLLDIKLGGISGVNLVQQLLSQGYTIPVVFLTAHPDMNLSDKLPNYPWQQLLKPVDASELVAAIRHALAQSPVHPPRA